MGALDEFNTWAVELSFENIDTEFGDCPIVHVDDDLWADDGRKVQNVQVEDVQVDDEEERLYNFYDCDQAEQLDKYTAIGCSASEAFNDHRVDDDRQHHFETV